MLDRGRLGTNSSEHCQHEGRENLRQACQAEETYPGLPHKVSRPRGADPLAQFLTWSTIATCRYSGLNEEKLASVTTRLEDVQRDLTKIIDWQTILIGHSLECDLRVLKVSERAGGPGTRAWIQLTCVGTPHDTPTQLIHSRVIDTSVIYQHPRGPPYKASLKWLAQKWLKREIQTSVAGADAVGGHDSEEDARTCIDLLQLKMQKGKAEGSTVRPWSGADQRPLVFSRNLPLGAPGPGFGEFQTDQETVFERIARGPDPKTSAVVDHGTPGQWHGAKAKTSIACTNDQEVSMGVDTVVVLLAVDALKSADR